jgi:predicted Zn-dependent peptidase
MTAEEIAALLKPMLESWERAPITLPPQTGLTAGESSHVTEEMDVAQGKLCLGFTTPITNRSDDYAAMVVMNNVFGAGMTSKLFVNVREKLSLCYSIGASYYGSKGIMTVGAGIDFDKEEKTRQEILNQLEACRRGEVTQEELNAVKEAIRSGIRAAHDSPGSIEGYYSTSAIYETAMNPEQYLRAVEAVTVEDVAAAARAVTYHSSYFLKGAEA